MTVIVRGGLRIHTVPKNASRSMRRSIKDEIYGSADPDVDGPGVRFMVVRHPGHRLVSAHAYMMHTLLVAKQKSRILPDNCQKWVEMGYRHDMTFSEFLCLALSRHDEDAHTRAQAAYAGPHPINILCPWENLHEGWDRLRRDFSFLEPLVWLNQSRHGVWQSYFSPEQERAVSQVFEEDLALYGRAIKERNQHGRRSNNDTGSPETDAESGIHASG